jgi:four helix bundle protein
MPGAKDLKVWQEAVALGADVIRAVRQTSRRETKAFTDQLLTSAGAPAAYIAEAHALASVADQRACYLRAKHALADIETRLAIARHAELLSPTTLAQLTTRVAAVSQLLGGYLAFIERQIGQ